jgi:lipopolysaccharide/colanic/teichoic acid biosynthesis glycosyltransferase
MRDDRRWGRGATAAGLPRWFEIIAAAYGLTLLAPLLLLVWLLIRLDSPGPALFRQERVGLNGRRFCCLKFRTMTAAAMPGWRTIADFTSYQFNPGGRRDARLTRAGAILRRTSVDELPQLLNVLRGEMALVGPRPEVPAIVAQYPPAYHRRHAVPPGVTGLAQVSGRADLSYAQTVAYDLDYVRRRSARLDLTIVWRTVAAVASGAGAR